MSIRVFKQQLLNELYAPYAACMMCPLGSAGRSRVVFGEGNPDAEIMLVGEGPGRDEDEQGMPFVGRSGKLLRKVLDAVGIDVATVYITNIVKCRPPSNRLPLPDERSICTNLLLYKQIKIIQPKVICALGSCAAQSLLYGDTPTALRITQVHGQSLHSPVLGPDITVIPVYHPAYVLRNQRELEPFMYDLATVARSAQSD